MRAIAIVLLLVMPFATHAKGGASAKIDAAKRAVASLLKDPGSAQFKNVAPAFHGQAVCGEVNGKNAFGGYVGFRPFVVDPSGAASIAGDGDGGYDTGATNVEMWCHD